MHHSIENPKGGAATIINFLTFYSVRLLNFWELLSYSYCNYWLQINLVFKMINLSQNWTESAQIGEYQNLFWLHSNSWILNEWYILKTVTQSSAWPCFTAFKSPTAERGQNHVSVFVTPSQHFQRLLLVFCTLRTDINVRSGIKIRAGKFGKNNKRTVWNKRTGGNFVISYHQYYKSPLSVLQQFPKEA